jgi:hypothetical protein
MSAASRERARLRNERHIVIKPPGENTEAPEEKVYHRGRASQLPYVRLSVVMDLAKAEFPDDAKELRMKKQRGTYYLVRPAQGKPGMVTLGYGNTAMEALVRARVTKITTAAKEAQAKKP